MTTKYVVVYYVNGTGAAPGKAVYESLGDDRVSFPERVMIRRARPKGIEWDYAVIEERHYNDE